jgi:hypothetical protein
MIGQQSGETAVARGEALEIHFKSVAPYFAESPRPSEQARELKIDQQVIEPCELRAIRIPHGEALHFEAEYVRVEMHAFDAGCPPEVLTQRVYDERLDQHRHSEEARQCVEQDEHDSPEPSAPGTQPWRSAPGALIRGPGCRTGCRLGGLVLHCFPRVSFSIFGR